MGSLAGSLFARTYQRDELGRITAVEDLADGVTTLWEYGYDAAGRLETVTPDSVAYASYTYDANGNRLTRTSGAGVETGVYDAQDRMTSYAGATYTYSANGELETKVEGADTTRYDYDVFGNLTRVDLPDGTVIEYVIDGRNRRVGKKVDGVLVQGFLYGDQLNPVAELDGSGNLVSRFIYGSKANVPDYMVRGGDTLRIVSDHLGSVRLVVDVVSGVVVQRLSYDAWGQVLEDTNPGSQPFGFAGGLRDDIVRRVRFGARDYDVVTGRWTAKDPILFNAGSTNLYAYAAGDPISSVDPFGLQEYPINLGQGWRARLDSYNYGGAAAYEIHVRNPSGQPAGIFGRDGWIKRHGFRKPPNVPRVIQNRINGIDIAKQRAIGGEVTPRGARMSRFGRMGGRLGAIGFLPILLDAHRAHVCAERNPGTSPWQWMLYWQGAAPSPVGGAAYFPTA